MCTLRCASSWSSCDTENDALHSVCEGKGQSFDSRKRQAKGYQENLQQRAGSEPGGTVRSRDFLELFAAEDAVKRTSTYTHMREHAHRHNTHPTRGQVLLNL